MLSWTSILYRLSFSWLVCLPPLSTFLHLLNWGFKLVLFLLSCTHPIALCLSVWLEKLTLLSCFSLIGSNDDSPDLQLCCDCAIWKGAWSYAFLSPLSWLKIVTLDDFLSAVLDTAYFTEWSTQCKKLEMNILIIEVRDTINIFRRPCPFFSCRDSTNSTMV